MDTWFQFFFGPDIENFLMTKYDTVNILQCLHEKLNDREGIYDS